MHRYLAHSLLHLRTHLLPDRTCCQLARVEIVKSDLGKHRQISKQPKAALPFNSRQARQLWRSVKRKNWKSLWMHARINQSVWTRRDALSTGLICPTQFNANRNHWQLVHKKVAFSQSSFPAIRPVPPAHCSNQSLGDPLPQCPGQPYVNLRLPKTLNPVNLRNFISTLTRIEPLYDYPNPVPARHDLLEILPKVVRIELLWSERQHCGASGAFEVKAC